MIQATDVLTKVPFSKLTDEQIIDLVELVLVVQNENYSAQRKRTKSELLKQLGLTP